MAYPTGLAQLPPYGLQGRSGIQRGIVDEAADWVWPGTKERWQDRLKKEQDLSRMGEFDAVSQAQSGSYGGLRDLTQKGLEVGFDTLNPAVIAGKAFAGILGGAKGNPDMYKEALRLRGLNTPKKQIYEDTGFAWDWMDNPRYRIPDIDASVTKNFGQGHVKATVGMSPQTWKLDRAFKHDRLYQDYPMMKDINVKVSPNKGKDAKTAYFKGEWIPELKQWDEKTVLYINPMKVKEWAKEAGISEIKVIRRIMLHELQHAMQVVERFPKGSNKQYFKALKDPKHKRTRIERLKELQSVVKTGNPKEAAIAQKEAINIMQHQKFIDSIKKSDDKSLYFDTMGELDARFVEADMDKAIDVLEKEMPHITRPEMTPDRPITVIDPKTGTPSLYGRKEKGNAAFNSLFGESSAEKLPYIRVRKDSKISPVISAPEDLAAFQKAIDDSATKLLIKTQSKYNTGKYVSPEASRYYGEMEQIIEEINVRGYSSLKDIRDPGIVLRALKDIIDMDIAGVVRNSITGYNSTQGQRIKARVRAASDLYDELSKKVFRDNPGFEKAYKEDNLRRDKEYKKYTDKTKGASVNKLDEILANPQGKQTSETSNTVQGINTINTTPKVYTEDQFKLIADELSALGSGQKAKIAIHKTLSTMQGPKTPHRVRAALLDAADTATDKNVISGYLRTAEEITEKGIKAPTDMGSATPKGGLETRPHKFGAFTKDPTGIPEYQYTKSVFDEEGTDWQEVAKNQYEEALTHPPGEKMLGQSYESVFAGGRQPKTLAQMRGMAEGRLGYTEGIRNDLQKMRTDTFKFMRDKLDNLGFDSPGQAMIQLRREFELGDDLAERWDLSDIETDKLVGYFTAEDVLSAAKKSQEALPHQYTKSALGERMPAELQSLVDDFAPTQRGSAFEPPVNYTDSALGKAPVNYLRELELEKNQLRGSAYESPIEYIEPQVQARPKSSPAKMTEKQVGWWNIMVNHLRDMNYSREKELTILETSKREWDELPNTERTLPKLNDIVSRNAQLQDIEF